MGHLKYVNYFPGEKSITYGIIEVKMSTQRLPQNIAVAVISFHKYGS